MTLVYSYFNIRAGFIDVALLACIDVMTMTNIRAELRISGTTATHIDMLGKIVQPAVMPPVSERPTYEDRHQDQPYEFPG